MKKLIVIVFIAAVLRLWNLGSVPPSLTWDEAALGYNAYSLMLTGRDEYGALLPLNLKSFGDYKPAIYSYIDVPFIALFGLTEVAVRLPSALLGIGLVVLVYFVIKEWFENEILAALVAFMLAISPLALQFTRPAYESNIALFFNVLAVYLFTKAQKNSKLYIAVALIFALSLFTYQASRFFVPLIAFTLWWIYRKQIIWNRNFKIAAGLFFVLIALVGVLLLGLGQGQRLVVTSYFSYSRSPDSVQQIATENNWPVSSGQFQLLHGEWFAYTRGLVERYLIYFSPKQMFIQGDQNPRHRVPDLGVLYYFSVFLIPAGFVYLISTKKRESHLILLWLLLAPLPGVLSRDLFTMLRSYNMLFPIVVLEGAGLWWWWQKVRVYSWRWVVVGIAAVLMVINISIFLDRYFIHAPFEYSEGWVYGSKQAVQEINTLTATKKYDQIFISDTYGQPYIFYLFYSHFPPQEFQKTVNLEQTGADVGTVRQQGQVHFRHVYWPEDKGIKNSLFVAPIEELPDKDIIGDSHYTILGQINFLDGLPAYRIVETH